MGQRHKEAIKKDLEAGEKEISKIDKKNAAIMAQTAKRLFESPSPLTNDKTKAFQVMTDIMNGIQKYDYELDDILKIYPNYLKDIASLSQDPRYANLDVVDDIKK
ncbi:MAG TPA: hypothetical protein P5241_00990 [Candidatus Paceibacterota bacterium]|nr:hypothetical protein [Candidatus Paceibacterota bacterium]